MRLATTIGDMYATCGKNPTEAIKCYENSGFRHLDFSFYSLAYNGSFLMSDNYMDEIESAGNIAAKLGMDFVQAHAPGENLFGENEDFIEKSIIRSIEACGYLGIKNIVLHQGFSKKFVYPTDNKAYNEANRKKFEKFYPAMEKYGVNVLIENTADVNIGGMSFPRSAEEMNEFIDLCSHPLLGCCWDVGHANIQNPDQYGDIVKLGKNLKAVHIQDNLGKRDDHLAPFMGTLDIDSVMHGLIDSGFVERGGCFTFEADNLLSPAKSWPNPRNAKFTDGKLSAPTKELRIESLRLLYLIGKTILTKYDLFED